VSPSEHDPSRDESTSFEVDRHTDDQPPRDDLLDLEEAPDAEPPFDEGAGAVDDPDPFRRDGEPPRYGDHPDDLPESQGFEPDEAERAAEDAGARHPLSDEEL
jgi:hypothetical protein